MLNKLRGKSFILIITLLSFTNWHCQQLEETSLANADDYLSRSTLNITAVNNGGLAGYFENYFYFKNGRDSVKVKIDSQNGISHLLTDEYTIGKDLFSEIKNSINCLVLNNDNDESPLPSCIGSNFSFFFLERYNRKMRLYAPLANCQLDSLLFDVFIKYAENDPANQLE